MSPDMSSYVEINGYLMVVRLIWGGVSGGPFAYGIRFSSIGFPRFDFWNANFIHNRVALLIWGNEENSFSFG